MYFMLRKKYPTYNKLPSSDLELWFRQFAVEANDSYYVYYLEVMRGRTLTRQQVKFRIP
ncbi:hypothetical protein N665_0048s0032 [Sinapis alba]|nr:hypothetical protein N665_0048s0032 [Sinapis alba]